MQVGKGGDCAMEVALEPVPRKESLSVAMEKIWALDGQYRTFCVPRPAGIQGRAPEHQSVPGL